MATAELCGHAVRGSAPGPRPGGTPRPAERAPGAVEKRGPYMVTRAPSLQAKLQKHRDLAKAVLRRKGMLGALPSRPDASGKRSVKFNKGYTPLSQSPDENLVSLDSDRCWACILWCVVFASQVLQTLLHALLSVSHCAQQASCN
ncbi:protein FAM219B isoform X3 [Dipodomys merriami]|uniref:protein FAM219B isoform X3 n=1 Tax=Dipodomys merriami TaxID=94247 RepID=UPI0038560E15